MKRLETEEGSRFFRRKAVLLQLSNVINELETRLFFLKGKVELSLYSGRGKHDYSELDAARDVAVGSFESGYLEGLSSPIETWQNWAEKVDFTDKKAKVTRGLALGMHLNLAQAHCIAMSSPNALRRFLMPARSSCPAAMRYSFSRAFRADS